MIDLDKAGEWTPEAELKLHIDDCVYLGCEDWSDRLGFVQMPSGYALMLDQDRMFFFWLRWDGKQSVIHWNQWAVYRGAKNDAAAINAATGGE